MVNKFLEKIGPGPLIAAAFIGPGTITLCTILGAKYCSNYPSGYGGKARCHW